MSAGAILTLGLGAFSDVNHVVTLGYNTGAAAKGVDKSGYVFGKRKKHYDIDEEELANVLANIAQRLAADWAENEEDDGGIVYH